MKLKVIIFWILFCNTLNVFATLDHSLLDSIKQSDNPIEQMELYIKLGDKHEYSDPNKAIYYYQKAFQTGTGFEASRRYQALIPQVEMLKAKSLRYVGIVYSDQGSFNDAIENYTMAHIILKELRELYTSQYKNEVNLKIAKLLNNMGVVYSRQGAFGMARDYYSHALEVYEELSDSTSIAVAYSSLGIVEARQANLAEALNLFQRALDIYTLKGNKEGQAQSYNNIGGIQFQLRNWDNALNLYMQAHDIYHDMGYLHRVAAIKGNIGLVYQNKKDFEAATQFLEQSLENRKQLDDKSGVVESYNNLGSLYEKLQDYAIARQYYTKSFDIASEIGDNRIKAIAQVNIGKMYSLDGNMPMALDWTQRGHTTASRHSLNFIVQSALKQLAELNAASGNFRQAYEFSEKHYEISQQILDEQKARNINELEIEYQARENQQRIEFLEQESELSFLQLKQSRTLIIVLALVSLVGLIMTGFVFIFIKQRNKIQLLRQEKEARSLIRKTDNDLKAIMKTHAHGMILLDNELNVISFNKLAEQWSKSFLGETLHENRPLVNYSNPLVNELQTEALYETLKGNSMELEKEVQVNGKTRYYKFFANPVFDDDDNFIQSLSLMIEDVTQRRTTQDKIMSDLREKETLIKEIHHRVKNNMQVIMSLIRMQTMKFKGKKELEAFSELEQRIAAMSYVHEEIYASHNLADISFGAYLKKISSNLAGAYNLPIQINNHINMKSPFLNIDVAMPCGLVVNELLSNALKHAFKNKEALGKDSRIDVYFTEHATTYELAVADNGQGLAENFDAQKISSMGFHLIKIIVEEQLGGNWDIQNDHGLTINVFFPKKSFS